MNDHTYLTPDSPETQPSTIKKWQEIDTSTPEGLRALDRAIAERLGWHTTSKTRKVGKSTWLYVAIYDDTGECLCSYCLSENDAWDFAPNYSTDPNQAITLLDTIKTYHRLEISKLYNRDGYYVRLNAHIEHTDESDPYTKTWSNGAITAALGICTCWLEWHDANGGQS